MAVILARKQCLPQQPTQQETQLQALVTLRPPIFIKKPSRFEHYKISIIWGKASALFANEMLLRYMG